MEFSNIQGVNMEMIIFIGIQASGKTSFYKERFFNTHLRISNDLLKTKNREKLLLDYCKKTEMPLVIDNTNITRSIREKYIQFSKDIGIPIIGYYFRSDIERSLKWNSCRNGKERIPKVGILGTYKKLETPSIDEGFDKLYFVDIVDDKFIVSEWKNEI
jgi:tRNA uridine 5-carbamoylmethylation protein Kti12